MTERNAVTWTASVGGYKTRITAELDADGHPVGLSTAGLGRPGSELDGLWRDFVKAWDVNIKKRRVPLDALATFLGRCDEMKGATGDPLAPKAGGPADYFAKSVFARFKPELLPEALDGEALVLAAGECL